jgi:hypothetical protein
MPLHPIVFLSKNSSLCTLNLNLLTNVLCAVFFLTPENSWAIKVLLLIWSHIWDRKEEEEIGRRKGGRQAVMANG